MPSWSQAAAFHVLNDWQNGYGDTTFFANSATGPTYGRDSYWTVDVYRHGIPREAVAVLLQGTLIITHGLTPGTAHLQAWLRPRGGPDDMVYWQTVTDSGGKRIPISSMVPLSEGQFEIWWSGQDLSSLPYPENSTYGINVSAVGYWV